MILQGTGIRSLLAAAVWAAAAAPVSADWLVTSDGTRIETEGPWEVRGRQVIFTRKHGALSALRLSDVDLEASEAATAAGEAPAAGAEAEGERRPVLVLTNEDIRPAAASPSDEPAAAGEAAEGPDEEGEEPAAAGPPSEAPVELVSWKANLSRQADGLEVVGVVRNNGSGVAAKVSVRVTIPDGEGGTLYETNAFLRSTGLAPGGSTTFRALLPGIFQLIEDPVFDVTAGELTLLGAGVPAAGEDESGGS